MTNNDFEYENLEEIYKDLPNVIKQFCKDKGITPSQLGIDLNYSKDTIYDRVPNPETKYFKFHISTKCNKCKQNISGDLILDRKGLNVVDSSGFMILEEPTCSKCLGEQ